MANIVLGVTGSIAAFKANDVVSILKKQGHNIKIVLTENASHFVTETVLAALSKEQVLTDMWKSEGQIDHIEVVNPWADLLAIIPATANFIGKAANGIADDFLSTVWLAAPCNKLLAPAMNTVMWENSSVQNNIEILKKQNVLFTDPVEGKLACGTTGVGKLAPVKTIISGINEALTTFKSCPECSTYYLKGVKCICKSKAKLLNIKFDPNFLDIYKTGKLLNLTYSDSKKSLYFGKTGEVDRAFNLLKEVRHWAN